MFNLKSTALPTASKIPLANANSSLFIHVKIAQQNSVIEIAAGVYELVRFDSRNRKTDSQQGAVPRPSNLQPSAILFGLCFFLNASAGPTGGLGQALDLQP